jgi:hypothetical protein
VPGVMCSLLGLFFEKKMHELNFLQIKMKQVAAFYFCI